MKFEINCNIELIRLFFVNDVCYLHIFFISLESIKSIESIEPIKSIEYIESIEYINSIDSIYSVDSMDSIKSNLYHDSLKFLKI